MMADRHRSLKQFFICCHNAGIVSDYTFCEKQKQIENLVRQVGGTSQVGQCHGIRHRSMIWIRKFKDGSRNSNGDVEPTQTCRRYFIFDKTSQEWLDSVPARYWSKQYQQVEGGPLFELACSEHPGWRWLCRFWEREEQGVEFNNFLSPPAKEEEVMYCRGCRCMKPEVEFRPSTKEVPHCKQCRQRRGEIPDYEVDAVSANLSDPAQTTAIPIKVSPSQKRKRCKN